MYDGHLRTQLSSQDKAEIGTELVEVMRTFILNRIEEYDVERFTSTDASAIVGIAFGGLVGFFRDHLGEVETIDHIPY